MKEWWTAQELADLNLPGLPGTVQNIRRAAEIRQWKSRKRESGKGKEYHLSALPLAAQVRLATLEKKALAQTAGVDEARLDSDDLWKWFATAGQAKQDEAKRRLEMLDAWETLYQKGGVTRDVSAAHIANHFGVAKSSLYNWLKLTHGRDRVDWLPALAPRHIGTVERVECSPEAWDFIRSAYLNDSKPPFSECFHDLERAAKDRGWAYPSERTLLRRLTKAVHPAVITYCREGAQAAARMFPAQERDRSHFTAMQAVNADGHTFDVMVWSRDGERIVRPIIVGFQDLYSGMIVAWRLTETENSWDVRLTIGDMVENYGIPKAVWLDNGRAFASKWLTGGTPTRFRFVIREEDPVGILTQLIGPDGIHWTTPYHGQSKPIERAWLDLTNGISRKAFCAGAYTGPNPVEKPESYATRALKWDDFEAFVASQINEHNDKQNRKAKNCAGRSFREAFNESYAKHPVMKITEEQRRLWLLAAEGLHVSKRDGSLKLMGNRYFGEFLHLHMGDKVAARFDPDFLHDGLHVYSMDGRYLGHAPVVEPVGFDDADKAREHARARKQWLRGVKLQRDAEVRMSQAQVAALVPLNLGPEAPPEARVVALARPVLDLKQTPRAEPLTDAQQQRQDALVLEFGRAPAPVKDDKTIRLERAARVEADLAAGRPVDEAEARWFERYKDLPEWKAHLALADFAATA